MAGEWDDLWQLYQMIPNKWIKLMHPPGPFRKPARLGVSTVEIPHLGPRAD